jgi:hypothetical protein
VNTKTKTGMIYIQLIFQALTIGMMGLVFFTFRSRSSQMQNELAIAQWFGTMDMVVDGQRWRGERSQMIESLDMQKSFAGISAKLLCATRSGRWFILSAETRFSLIINWGVEPITEDEAAILVGMEKKEFLLAKAQIAWPKDHEEVKQKEHRQAPQENSPNAEAGIEQ